MNDDAGFNLRCAVNQVRYTLTNLADPFGQAVNKFVELGRAGSLLIGVVTDVVAPAYAYRVQFGDGYPVCVAYAAFLGATGNAGMRSTTTIPVGSRVICMIRHWPLVAYIIGVIPMFGKLSSPPDMLYVGSRQRVDDAHFQPINMADKSVYDACGGRFMDATMVGEVGWNAETGLRLHLDPFMFMLSVDESCGVFGFYHDQMLRIAGYNFQERTSGREYECLDDQGEYIEYEGLTPYPWENLGLWEPGDPIREFSPDEWQKQMPWYGPWEPKDDHQKPWHRIQRYGGYLGQGGKRLVVGPPVTPPDVISKYSRGGEADEQFPGLFSETIGLDGRYTLESAKGISILKHCAIITPTRMRRPEQVTDSTGDCNENYRAAGYQGGGQEHTIADTLAAEDDYPSLQRAAGLLDFHAYLFNYAGVHPFHWHAKDWSIPQADQLQHVDRDIAQIDYSALAEQPSLQPPEAKFLKIDHRLTNVAYYPTTCGIDLLEDGGVVIHDGWGSEIRMTGGNIFISAPGDIWFQSGRNVNTWAGYDAIIKAKNCIEATATERDVRLKAEQHFQVLAGNSNNNGGVLIESRGRRSDFNFENIGEKVEAAGIILKANSSTIAGWGRDIYLRTGGGNVSAGSIILDADRGSRSIVTHSNSLVNFVRSAVFQYFGTEDDVQSGNEFRPGFTMLGGNVAVNGWFINTSHVISDGWIVSGKQHIITDRANEYKNLVSPLSDYGRQSVREFVTNITNRAQSQLPGWGKNMFTALENLVYTAGKLGDDELMEHAEFSLRTDEEYKTNNFALFESRWQQIARAAGDAAYKWTEKPVRSAIQGDTYPYPGTNAYNQEVFYRQELELFDLQRGLPKNRGEKGELAEAYRNAKYKKPKAVSLDEYPLAFGETQS